MPNPYFDALGRPPRDGKARKAKPGPSHLRARKQELETAKRLLTPASGAGDVKGDVRARRAFRVECKTTKHDSFRITLDMVRVLEEAALSTGEMPVFVIEFNKDGKKIADLCVCPSYVLDGICDVDK